MIRAAPPHPPVSDRPRQERSSVPVRGVEIVPRTFTLVAGPCAIETASQSRAAWAATVAAGAMPCAVTRSAELTAGLRGLARQVGHSGRG